MWNPEGASDRSPLRPCFDRRLKLELHGSRVTSDAGLLAYRELDDALGLTALAGDVLADSRTGKNGWHGVVGLLRQSVYGRLAGYEDVNDAERLGRDPAMRWIVGGKAVERGGASTSQMGRFETELLANDENLAALADLSGVWIDRVHARKLPRMIVLDMDTGVKARLDGRVLSIPLLVVLGVRRDGQKVLLAVKNMGGETEAAWRHVLEDLLGRGLKAPELLIVDGGKGLEAALASLWSDIPVQRCTVHKERNLLAHAPKALHDEVKADYTDMIYAENAEQVRKKRKAFLAKWRLRCRGVADSLDEAGERLFTFLRYPPQQWKSLRTTNAIECLHGEFKRRVKTQCALPNAETAAMLFWALMASGQITMRRVGGWQTLDQAPVKKPIDLAA